MLPPKGGNYADLQAIKGKLLYRRRRAPGPATRRAPSSTSISPEREEKTVLEEADCFETTADGKKMLVVNKKKFAILDIKAAQKFEKPMVTADMEAPVDPRGGVAADVPRRVPLRARLLLRPRTCTAWTGRRWASATARCSRMR